MEWFSAFWDTAGPGVIAGTIVVLWDVLRIWFQSRWLVRKLNQPDKVLEGLEAIKKKLGVDDESEYTGSD